MTKLQDIPVLYINLDKRIDRRKHIENQFDDFKNVERIEAINTCDTNGYYGCVLSHLKALKLAKQKGYYEVLICEDDFEWIDKTKFQYPIYDFDICMLDCDVVHSKDIFRDYKRVTWGLRSGGYIIKQHYYDTLIECFTESYEKLKKNLIRDNYHDVYWQVLQKRDNFIIQYPKIGKQIEGYSDIKKKVMKRE